MSKKILIVEDEIHIQRLITMMLERDGYVVETVSSGEEGLTKLYSGTTLPDLVLLDIMMPGIDGIAVLRAIKANSRTKAVPVVMLTALAEEGIIIQGAKLGIKDYIRKPFHPQELVERVRKNLEPVKN
jgi:two-component system phosphate regulon response regulator PhoB